MRRPPSPCAALPCPPASPPPLSPHPSPASANLLPPKSTWRWSEPHERSVCARGAAGCCMSLEVSPMAPHSRALHPSGRSHTCEGPSGGRWWALLQEGPSQQEVGTPMQPWPWGPQDLPHRSSAHPSCLRPVPCHPPAPHSPTSFPVGAGTLELTALPDGQGSTTPLSRFATETPNPMGNMRGDVTNAQ